ncbi:MAG: hypothetical protein ACR2OZ_09540 [Verrucomicrobiales bacterium]
MKACELFQKISPSLANNIIGYLRDQQKEVYRAAVGTLATQRKLRPQFVQKKSREQQAAWILDTLKLRSSESIGEQVLQVWLMKAKAAMLVQFLNALGIAHDGNGAVDDLPSTLDAAKLKEALDKLLENFPGEDVAVYLNIFQLQQPGGWPEVSEALASDPRLKLG